MFCNRNYVIVLWEKCNNSVKTALVQMVIFRTAAVFVLQP